MEQWQPATWPDGTWPAPCPMPRHGGRHRTSVATAPAIDDDPGDITLEQCEQALCAPGVDPHRLGQLGELAARLWLRGKSWIILDTNWHSRYGELDIVALTTHRSIVFVEVKTRRATAQGTPEEAVHAGKQASVRRTATLWLQRYGSRIGHVGIRFDVVTVGVHHGAVTFHHLVEAF